MGEAIVIDVALQGSLDAEVALSFDRTIDRHQVHRTAIAEVFITDARAVDEHRVLLGAQLPACHSYFNDHPWHGATVDPLLVMEIGRQATLASAHALGVPTDVVLISEEFALRITQPDAWRSAGPATEVRVDSVFTWTRVRQGRPRAGICEQVILVDGRPAATHRSGGRLLSRADLALLRTAQRETAPPSTGDLLDRPYPGAVLPARVGRHDPRNVVLAELNREGKAMQARVAPRWSNRALFDHSYDHLTMQVLTEAARQLALAAMDGSSAGYLRNWEVVGLTGRFARFAELDSAVTASTVAPMAPGSSPMLRIHLEQDGDRVADLAVTMARYRSRP